MTLSLSHHQFILKIFRPYQTISRDNLEIKGRFFLDVFLVHLWCAPFFSYWNTARDSTSLSRQTKKHWLKIRNAECFPAFAWLTLLAQSLFTTLNIRKAITHWREQQSEENIQRAIVWMCCRSACCVSFDTNTALGSHNLSFTITSHCDFKVFSSSESDFHAVKQWQKNKNWISF